MKPESALTSFQAYVAHRGLTPSSLTVPQGVDLVLSFYRDERAEGCPFDHDADMLLFQWGVFKRGPGEHFEFDLTRQLIFGDAVEDDDRIWQLSLTFLFEPSPALRQIERSNQWCQSTAELTAFEKFVRRSEAFKAIGQVPCQQVTLRFECAG